MRHAILILVLVGNLPAAMVCADGPKVAANIYNQAAEEILISPQASERGRSRLVKDSRARNGYALVADPADKPGADFSDGNIWYAYAYQQGPGRIRGTFRLKVADNTVAKPVVGIRIGIDNGDLKSGQSALRKLKGTDFTASNTYQEFSLDVLKGEQGFCGGSVTLLSNATKVSFDGFSVQQVSTFDMAELLAHLNPPAKPVGLAVGGGPLLVHETHGLYMEFWKVRQSLDLLHESLRARTQWAQSYLTVHPQRTAWPDIRPSGRTSTAIAS